MKSSKLSDVFKLDKKNRELDFVDLDLLVDLQLYVDPILLYRSAIKEFNEAHSLIVEFFTRAISYVKKSKHYNAEMMCQFPDAENLLGISADSHKGRGPSNKLGYKIYEELVNNQEILEKGLVFLSEFHLMIEGLSFDLISDAAVQISKEVFIKYTQEQCNLNKIPLQNVPIDHCFDWEENEWHSKHALLPCNPLKNDEPFLLTPWTVVRRYPEGDYQQFYREIYRYVLQAREKEHLWQALGKEPKVSFKDIAEKYKINKSKIIAYAKENPKDKEKFYNKISLPNETFSLEKLSLQLDTNINQVIYPQTLNTIINASSDKNYNSLLKQTSPQLERQIKLKRPKKKLLTDLQRVVIESKKRLVLLLGNFQNTDGMKRVEEIKSILQKDYTVITMKDLQHVKSESLTSSVAKIATLARFVVLEDSYPGGQLSELELLKVIEVVVPILREKGKQSSFMSAGKSVLFSNFNEIDYELIKNNGIDGKYVLEAANWAEKKLEALGEFWKNEYPWQK